MARLSQTTSAEADSARGQTRRAFALEAGGSRDRGDDVVGAEGRHYPERVRAGAVRMGELIDALLELSRLSRRRTVRGRVDLSAVAGEIVAALQSAEPDRRVEVEIQDGLLAEADLALVRSVLQNLFANAYKFTSGAPADRSSARRGSRRAIGSTGIATEYMQALQERYQPVRMIRIHASAEACFRRFKARDASAHVPVSENRFREINERAAQASFNWDCVLNNDAGLTEEEIADAVACVLWLSDHFRRFWRGGRPDGRPPNRGR